jgi:hypothetical protein
MEQQIDTYIVHITSASSRDNRGEEEEGDKEEEEGDEEKEEELFQNRHINPWFRGTPDLRGGKGLAQLRPKRRAPGLGEEGRREGE